MSELGNFRTDTTGRNEKLFVHRMNACQPNVNMQAIYLVYYLVCGLRIAVATASDCLQCHRVRKFCVGNFAGSFNFVEVEFFLEKKSVNFLCFFHLEWKTLKLK